MYMKKTAGDTRHHIIKKGRLKRKIGSCPSSATSPHFLLQTVIYKERSLGLALWFQTTHTKINKV